jgi:SAM-dependent methyltransferase
LGALCQASALSSKNHESSTWTRYLKAGGRTEPVDPDRFRELMRHDDYSRASAYDPVWTHLNLMGPNVMWLTEALAEVLPLEPGMRVLDLGCGSAISSIFLAREFGVEVWAADLWIDPSVNRPRVREAGVADRVFPIEAEAHALPFAHRFFDALVSIDSYHYFGTDMRYLSYAAQFVRPDGHIGIVVPGNAVDPDDLAPELAANAPFGADYFTFRSADWWARHWSRTAGVEVTHADMLAKELWLRYAHAGEAWDGLPMAETGDGPLLLSEHGRHLGFARVTARRTGEAPLIFGPGRYMTRLA